MTDTSRVQRRTVAADDDGIRVDRWFKRYLPDIGFGQLSKMLRKGEVRLDGKRVDGKTRLTAGQELRIPPLDGRKSSKPRRGTNSDAFNISEEDRDYIRSLVLFEDDALIAINKPPGLPTQGGTGITRHVDALSPALVNTHAARPKLVHRLDKDTSGVLLLGKSAKAAAALAAAFKDRDAQKTYHAIVVGLPKPSEGRISARIDKDARGQVEKMAVLDTGKPAVTDYRVLDTAAGQASLVELRPLTGRTHQLRVHMAHMDTPILGDGKYGAKAAFITGAVSRKLHLHARSIALAHPNGHMLKISARYADHFRDSLALLGLQPQEEG